MKEFRHDFTISDAAIFGFKEYSVESLRAVLEQRGVRWQNWQNEPGETFEELLDNLNKHRVQLVLRDGMKPFLAVQAAVVYVEYNDNGTLLEIHEDRQVIHATGQKLERGYRGVGETLRRDEEDGEGAVRCLDEELGFKQPNKYQLWPQTPYLVERHCEVSDKWSGLGVLHFRFLFKSVIPQELFRREGYVEHKPDRDIFFRWRPI